ncbi:hypothetical protein LVJ83_03105 [Uruburuella testudinis]|uniref:DUF4376 domain-containing protein n=1 Tax=Uruburuella testudinis TaxID=1282863 RepID=A0ABY4DTV7_9NEIS|nr:hypothetical protein [Uruburuella testudinis]UOO82472.1 hypothetical protein LVJ83_03105 [Uruburuella testudinis]
MKTLNDVKKSLINLGFNQGFDLTDPKISKDIVHEQGQMRWFKDYTSEGDWDNEFKEDINNFLHYMDEYQIAINENNFKIASDALCMAMIYAGNLSLNFDAIKTDISTLLRADYKTNDFPWPLLNNE